MTAQNGEGVYGDGVGVVTPLAHKLSQNGLLVKDATGTPRSGVFYAGTATLVTGKASMAYDVAPFEAAICRARTKGTSFPTNDGVVTVPTAAAPGANSRIDIIYLQQAEASEGDPDTEAVIDVAQGTASSSPTAPAIPDGAIELARAVVGAGITGTQDAVITQTAAFTAAAGGVIPFRSSTERDAFSAAEGQLGWLLDSDRLEVFNGSGWRSPGDSVIASGTITAQSSFNIDGLTGYSEYEIVLDLPTSSAANTLAAQLRSGGSSDSSSNYDMQRDTGADSATAAAGTYGASSWAALTVSDRSDKFIRLKINGLNEARRTMAQVEVNAFNATNNGIRNAVALRHRSASAFNGIGFTTSGGTVTGTYTVYAR